ncbi:hypothetical protein D3C79_725680 [compost metagenome]
MVSACSPCTRNCPRSMRSKRMASIRMKKRVMMAISSTVTRPGMAAIMPSSMSPHRANRESPSRSLQARVWGKRPST